MLREKYISFFSFFFYYCDAGLGLDKGGRKVGRADSIDRSRKSFLEMIFENYWQILNFKDWLILNGSSFILVKFRYLKT